MIYLIGILIILILTIFSVIVEKAKPATGTNEQPEVPKTLWEKIDDWFNKWILTPFITTATVAASIYALLLPPGDKGVFKLAIISLIIAMGVVHIIEKFILKGWSLGDEIKKGNQAAALAFIGICIVVSTVISKIMP